MNGSFLENQKTCGFCLCNAIIGLKILIFRTSGLQIPMNKLQIQMNKNKIKNNTKSKGVHKKPFCFCFFQYNSVILQPIKRMENTLYNYLVNNL